MRIAASVFVLFTVASATAQVLAPVDDRVAIGCALESVAPAQMTSVVRLRNNAPSNIVLEVDGNLSLAGRDQLIVLAMPMTIAGDFRPASGPRLQAGQEISVTLTIRPEAMAARSVMATEARVQFFASEPAGTSWICVLREADAAQLAKLVQR
jgi:hypothetical protein